MTVIYPQPLINSRLTDVVNAIDAGGTAGSCQLYDAGSNLISTLTLAFPCGVVAGGALNFTTPWTDPAAVGGTPVSARILDSTGSNVVTGLTVGTGSTSFDIILSGGSITAGQTVTINTASVTGR